MKRIEVLDVWRSLAVFIMLLYHALYDLALFGVFDMSLFDTAALEITEFIGSCLFVILGGATASLSRDKIRRGFRIFCIGFAVSLVMSFMGMAVKFGALQFFGVAFIVYGLADKRWECPTRTVFPAVCAVLFFASYAATKLIELPFDWLYPFGFHSSEFYSADYYPVLPWIFQFALGAWLGLRLRARAENGHEMRRFPPALVFLGRRSLLIYILHQPIFYGICILIFGRK